LQYGPFTGSRLANELFLEASRLGMPIDGRFVNAALRCFGNELDAALVIWKDTVRPQCMALEKRTSSQDKRNLIAAYNGLLYVCGRALRPDIALRVVYAMSKDGIDANDASLNTYRSGSRIQQQKRTDNGKNAAGGFRLAIERTFKLMEQYEALLIVECTKYDKNDRRRDGEPRIRIIL
jgi:pentatricopeptide repeat protein